MQFDSCSYFLFLPIVYLLFYFAGDRARWLVLLASSIFFYAAFKVPSLLVLLALVTLLSYTVALRLGRDIDPATRKYFFWAGLAGNLLLLGFSKYLPAIFHSFHVPLLAESTSGDHFVAIGVSYFTFQAISYLADVYLGVAEPERHLGHFCVYMSFFPKLLQGPIERSNDLLPQLKQPFTFNYDNVRSGMMLFLWGLFQKIVVADRLAQLVSPVYDNVHGSGGPAFLTATYIFALQIYFDFSGYTDMALGTARLFNIRLSPNFNAPYLATSVAEFWRRWHMSFSRWILDYIFMPLQMQWRQWRTWGTALALLVTFFVSGIWHGARWTFIIWGVLHGCYLAASVLWRSLKLKKLKLPPTVQRLITFNLVCFAWIFFRANSVDDAFYIVRRLLSIPSYDLHGVPLFSLNVSDLFVLIVSLLIALFFNFRKVEGTFFKRPFWIRWPAYVALVLWVVTFAINSNIGFLYSKF